jgi:ATP-binding cassette subfamily B protein
MDSGPESANESAVELSVLSKGEERLPLLQEQPLDVPSNDRKQKDKKKQKKKGGGSRTVEQLSKLCAFMKYQKARIAVGSTAMLLDSLAGMLMPKIMGDVVDNLSGDKDPARLKQSILALLVLILFQALNGGVRRYAWATAGDILTNVLKEELFVRMMMHPIPFFDTTQSGDLVNRLTDDTSKLRGTLSRNLPACARSVVIFFLGLGCMLYLSWKLTLVTLICGPAVAVALRYYGKKVRKLGRKTQDMMAESTSVAAEAIQNVRIVKAFVTEQFTTDKFHREMHNALQARFEWAKYSSIMELCMSLFPGMSMCLLIYVGGSMVVSGDLSAGTLTSFMFYTMKVIGELGNFTAIYSDVMSSLGSSERVFEIIGSAQPADGRTSIPGQDARLELTFEGVHFAYPSRPDEVVLHNFDMHLQPGKMVALVGMSGGGKSTVVALLLGFYDPIRGCIRWNGVDAKELNPHFLRKYIGLVSQDPVLFSASIEENIAIGKPDASFAEIQEAARMANADDFIRGFADGYRTMVGERGVRLSGGQRQRIAIARALLIRPRILVLDEATSALDAESEHQVQQALNSIIGRKQTENQSMLVIGHRLSTVINANQILVMKDGMAVEKGTHAELLQFDGVYANLVRHQLTSSQPV